MIGCIKCTHHIKELQLYNVIYLLYYIFYIISSILYLLYIYNRLAHFMVILHDYSLLSTS